jgi:hypothetical protein
MMSNRRGVLAMTVLRWVLLVLCLWLSVASAHQDSCHRLHSCPSDHGTYVCGDKGAVISARIITGAWPGSHAWRPRRLPLQGHGPHRLAQPPRPRR